MGSDGITLSGGQRQRIALARAVYSKRSCILLDDVLSAVDGTVRRHILENCLIELLKRRGKTVVLVTHDEAVASHTEIDSVLVLKNSTCQMVPSSTYRSNRLNRTNGLNGLGNRTEKIRESKKNENNHTDNETKNNIETKKGNDNENPNNKDNNNKDNKDNKYIKDRHEGTLSCNTILKYFRSVGVLSVIITGLLFVLGSTLSIGQQWYLTVWVHENNIGNHTNQIFINTEDT